MNTEISNTQIIVNENLSLLLEIGTEEIPARFLPVAIRNLRDSTAAALIDNYIHFSEIKAYATPRRLVLMAHGLPEMQEARTREVFGPPRKAAFDKEGKPTKAASGFAQSQGVSVENLVIRQKDKGEYLAAVIHEEGAPVRNLLPELLSNLILSLRFPKTMRWADRSMRFARPIHWIVSMFGNETVVFEIDEIRSGNRTRGHRFLAPNEFEIQSIYEYQNELKSRYVILDQEERKAVILEGIGRLATKAGGTPLHDDALLEMVNFIVEYPMPVLCSFQKEYLALPRELLVTVMKDHQKYFAVENTGGNLLNHFIVISNTLEGNSDTVRIGAERVIRARFEDARFYFAEDRKKTLHDRIEDLKKVTFHDRLGSIHAKTERIVALAGFFADKLTPSLKDNLVRAAWLAKTDLITGVVREFPELQGIMGKYYATHDRENKEVAQALKEQYLPSHSGGKLPETDTGALLSISDKMDSIAAFFSIGITPSGSEDPFALRRQALGIMAILADRGYPITIKELTDRALQNFPDAKDKVEARNGILQFFEQRFEPIFADQGYASDLIQAVMPLAFDIDVHDFQERLNALKKFTGDEQYDGFLLAIKRVNNIIPKTAVPVFNKDLLVEQAEKNLYDCFAGVFLGEIFAGYIKNKQYYDAILNLCLLKDPITDFFDQILVMDKREEIKQNRLALLKIIWTEASRIADFSRLKENK